MMILTPQLKQMLQNYKATLEAEQYKSFENEVGMLILHYFNHLLTIPAGVLRAKEVHALIESEIDKAQQVKTSCYKGCGACCHLEIEITSDDAALLAHSILQNKLQIDESRMKNQSQRERLSPLWQNRVAKENRCVFLGDDQACTNYINRPMVCRKHSVVSDPKECMSENGQPVPRLIPYAEIIMSAALNLPNNQFGQFAKMLEKALIEQRSQKKMHQLDFQENERDNGNAAEVKNEALAVKDRHEVDL